MLLHGTEAEGGGRRCDQGPAIIGDFSTALAMMWEYEKKDNGKFYENYEVFYFTAAWHNPQVAYHLIQLLEKKGMMLL